MTQVQIKFWIFIALLCFLLSPFYRTPDQMAGFVQEEIRHTQSALGSTWGGGIIKKATELFQTAPLQVSHHIFSRGEYDIRKEGNENVLYDKGSMQITFGFMNKLMAGYGAMLFIMCVRFMIVISWLLLLWPMLLAAMYDGITQRKIKFANFRAIRPGTYTLLLMCVTPFAMSPLLYLVAPFTVTANAVPLLTCLVLLPLSVLMANSQPIFAEK